MSQPFYYDSGYRVSRDGVPTIVYHRGNSTHRAMIAIAAETGIALELDDCPQFGFTPSGDALAKAAAYRSSFRPTISTGTALAQYYTPASVVRRIICGVPCRVARERAGTSSAHLSGWATLSAPMDGWEYRAEQFRAELVRRGRWESAGVEPPKELLREFTTRRAAERVAALLRAADGLAREVQRVGGIKRRYLVAA